LVRHGPEPNAASTPLKGQTGSPCDRAEKRVAHQCALAALFDEFSRGERVVIERLDSEGLEGVTDIRVTAKGENAVSDAILPPIGFPGVRAA
jgi:hypothetical protein